MYKIQSPSFGEERNQVQMYRIGMYFKIQNAEYFAKFDLFIYVPIL